MAVNILIVDDNPDNLRLLSDILREKGYQARKAITGSLALQSLEATSFDLILMDINLPGMNGYEICQKIKENPQTQNIPVIFISAYNEPLDKVKAFKVGGIDYITKPLHNEEVLIRVENQVKIINLQREISLQNLKLKQQYIERSQQLEKTEQSLQKSQKQLLDKSLRDHVTGLDNRVAFMGNLTKACRQLQENEDYNFAVLVIECTYLDIYAQLLSEELKDKILSAIATILTSCLPSNSNLARLNDNQFVILQTEINNITIATELVEKLYDKYDKPLLLEPQEIFVDFYCGIISGDILRKCNKKQNPRNQSEYLLRKGKIALVKAQEATDNKYHYFIFTPQFNQNFKSELKLHLNWLKFINNQQLKIDYYPVFNFNNNQIKGLYSRINWNSFSAKITEPEAIRAWLNNKKSLENLNTLLIKTACKQIQKWEEQILWNESSKYIWDPNFTVRIPLSSEQFFLPSLSEQIKHITKEFSINLENISLEISDVALLSQPIATQQILQRLKQLNIQLSINNFSTNYFELNQEHQFPFQNLIINSYFLQDNKELMPNIISQVHKHNMTLTVANITQQQQIDYLYEIGCDFGQGDWLTKKLAPELIPYF